MSYKLKPLHYFLIAVVISIFKVSVRGFDNSFCNEACQKEKIESARREEKRREQKQLQDARRRMATRRNPHYDPFLRYNQQNWDRINRWEKEEERMWDSFKKNYE